jgi:hypothetical protein
MTCATYYLDAHTHTAAAPLPAEYLIITTCCLLLAGAVGVFGNSNHYYQPAFVFPAQLGSGYAKYVWEAVSHGE